jgi:hypothetical protein
MDQYFSGVLLSLPAASFWGSFGGLLFLEELNHTQILGAILLLSTVNLIQLLGGHSQA